ncbi:hypothetical protein SLS62_001315, partial [Diatrype stigma]
MPALFCPFTFACPLIKRYARRVFLGRRKPERVYTHHEQPMWTRVKHLPPYVEDVEDEGEPVAEPIAASTPKRIVSIVSPKPIDKANRPKQVKAFFDIMEEMECSGN